MSNAAENLAGQASGHTVERVKVPLLAELLARQTGERRRVWVDLGGAQPGLVSRLSGGRDLLIVADLPNAGETDEAGWHLPGSLLDGLFDAGRLTDLADYILCWDLLNYMRTEQLGQLARQLDRRARRDCSIHALIQYSATAMSSTPGRFALEADGQLNAVTTGAPYIPTPRYSPRALEKAMPELRVERTMLLNNGLQEFIFSVR